MDLLKKRRKELGLTQSELGRLVGLAGNTITNYEKGQREPNIDTLVKLSKVLNCTVDDLIKDELKVNSETAP